MIKTEIWTFVLRAAIYIYIYRGSQDKSPYLSFYHFAGERFKVFAQKFPFTVGLVLKVLRCCLHAHKGKTLKFLGIYSIFCWTNFKGVLRGLKVIRPFVTWPKDSFFWKALVTPRYVCLSSYQVSISTGKLW